MPSEYRRLLDPPRGRFFLFGVRGVGKSTWARGRLPKAVHIDLLDERRYHDLLTSPGAFGDELRKLACGTTVVVDEIQRLPSLLNEVHRAIEGRRLRFALLGSSARKLKTAGTNLLAGRATWRTLRPLTPTELGKDFDLERVLRHGSIPLIWTAEDPRERLRAYVRVYLSEEIRAEALVRSLEADAVAAVGDDAVEVPAQEGAELLHLGKALPAESRDPAVEEVRNAEVYSSGDLRFPRLHFPLAAPARVRAGAGEPASRPWESPIRRRATAIGYSSCPLPPALTARRDGTRFKRSVRSAGAEKTCFRPIGDRTSRSRSTRSRRSDRAVS